MNARLNRWDAKSLNELSNRSFYDAIRYKYEYEYSFLVTEIASKLWNIVCRAVHDTITGIQDGDIKWKHVPRYRPFVRGIYWSRVNFPNKAQWRGASIYSLICAWTNGWVNNRYAADFRRNRAHYDVTEMCHHWVDTGIVLGVWNRRIIPGIGS